jgi:hypothetical protein
VMADMSAMVALVTGVETMVAFQFVLYRQI